MICMSCWNPCLLHIDATCEKVGGDQNAGRTRAELSHDKIALLSYPHCSICYIYIYVVGIPPLVKDARLLDSGHTQVS